MARRFLSAYRITLVLDLGITIWNFGCKASNIITEISRVVNGINSFAKTAGLIWVVAGLERADIQAIAQKQLLIEGSYRKSKHHVAEELSGFLPNFCICKVNAESHSLIKSSKALTASGLNLDKSSCF